jgi:hypothetical protein
MPTHDDACTFPGCDFAGCRAHRSCGWCGYPPVGEAELTRDATGNRWCGDCDRQSILAGDWDRAIEENWDQEYTPTACDYDALEIR